MRKVVWILGAVAAVAVAGFLHWTLPQRDIVRIVGTEVARMSAHRTDGTEGASPRTRDVWFITTVTPSGDSVVFRNEDTGWGWPPYFKFNSADIAARANDMVSTRENPQWVVITHYGWRVPIFSAFPNAVDIRPAESVDEGLFPWFNLIVILALIVGVLFLGSRVRRFFGRP